MKKKPADPLAGVRVLEFGHVAAGPFTGMLLADLGADVVKVEPASGDQMRAWPPLREIEGEQFSYNFASLNRNKRSIVADLKDPADLEAVLRLVSEADVLIENYRPGSMDRLGLGFEAVSEGHRGLVYCSISGFGRTSPYAHLGAFDLVVQGMSGLMSVTGDPEGDPAKCGVPVGDFVTALYGALTISAALRSVNGTGKSHFIDCSMLDSLIAIAALQTSELDGTGAAPQRLGSRHPRNAPYQAFRGMDKGFTVAAGNDNLWRKTCEVTSQEELVDDPRFVSQSLRTQNQGELESILNAVFGTRPASHWIAQLQSSGVPAGPINTFAEILADDHCKVSGLVDDIHVPGLGSVISVGYPARIDSAAPRRDLLPPRLGEHTARIHQEWSST
ncbi:CaiB/BaiF CoA transferase family protein [Paenarthrobacter nitroguajacolicus]|uniref:CaiB/BaiF CoA transferase family protein n=1 Tax=Paenarthrobacter nitroguajacolicus TaxID=211146 RepID=UPI004053B971